MSHFRNFFIFLLIATLFTTEIFWIVAKTNVYIQKALQSEEQYRGKNWSTITIALTQFLWWIDVTWGIVSNTFDWSKFPSSFDWKWNYVEKMNQCVKINNDNEIMTRRPQKSNNPLFPPPPIFLLFIFYLHIIHNTHTHKHTHTTHLYKETHSFSHFIRYVSLSLSPSPSSSTPSSSRDKSMVKRLEHDFQYYFCEKDYFRQECTFTFSFIQWIQTICDTFINNLECDSY